MCLAPFLVLWAQLGTKQKTPSRPAWGWHAGMHLSSRNNSRVWGAGRNQAKAGKRNIEEVGKQEGGSREWRSSCQGLEESNAFWRVPLAVTMVIGLWWSSLKLKARFCYFCDIRMWQSQSLCVGWLKPTSEIQYWGNDPEILSIRFSS